MPSLTSFLISHPRTGPRSSTNEYLSICRSILMRNELSAADTIWIHASSPGISAVTKHGTGLFTFLEHDGVPWNKGNAEAAIKGLSRYRRPSDGRFTERSLRE
jgi:hypothetical protein